MQVRARRDLLILFALDSLSIATLTILQAGGSVNYFVELFVRRSSRTCFRHASLVFLGGSGAGAGLFVTALFGIFFIAPLTIQFYSAMHGAIGSAGVRAANENFRRLEGALIGQHIFSTVPRIALLGPQPALMEPFCFPTRTD